VTTITRCRLASDTDYLSKLELESISQELKKCSPKLAIELIGTQTNQCRVDGDDIPNSPGRVARLMRGLLKERYDALVLNAAYLPSKLPSGLTIGAIDKRLTPYDVLISSHDCLLDELPDNATIVANDIRRESHGYYPLYFVLVMGISGAFLTGDMFNLYVWFEVMLIASFVLTALGGERAQMEGALKYVTLNLLSSAIFLAAVGTLYGVVGTLNMADLARVLPSVEYGLVNTLAMMFLVAFGLKAAIFPLFFWSSSFEKFQPFTSFLKSFGNFLSYTIGTFGLIFIKLISKPHLKIYFI